MRKIALIFTVLTLLLSACAQAAPVAVAPVEEPVAEAPAAVEEPLVDPTAVPEPTSAPVAAPEPAKITIAMRPYMSFAPIYIAVVEGYFADEGIEVEMIDVANASEGLVGLATKQVDMSAGLVDTGSLNLIGQNQGVKIVADVGYITPDTTCPYTAFLVREEDPDYEPGMDMSFLDGDSIINWTNAVTEFALDKALQTSGRSIIDFKGENLGAPVRGEGLKSGQYGLAGMGEPWITRALKGGEVKVWVSLNELIPDGQQGTVWFGPTLTVDNPDLGVRVMRAYKRGVEQYNLGTTDRNLEIFAEFAKQDPAEMKTTCLQTIRPDLSVNMDFILEFEEWAVGLDLMDEVYPIGVLYDGRFIDAVNAE